MKCQTSNCTNEAEKYRKWCYKCRQRQYREKHTLHYEYLEFRKRARRRGKEFRLTEEEFKKFCEVTNYLEEKGIYKDNCSIDRIDPTKGYSYDNIRKVTVSVNSKLNAGTLDAEWVLLDYCPF